MTQTSPLFLSWNRYGASAVWQHLTCSWNTCMRECLSLSFCSSCECRSRSSPLSLLLSPCRPHRDSTRLWTPACVAASLLGSPEIHNRTCHIMYIQSQRAVYLLNFLSCFHSMLQCLCVILTISDTSLSTSHIWFPLQVFGVILLARHVRWWQWCSVRWRAGEAKVVRHGGPSEMCLQEWWTETPSWAVLICRDAEFPLHVYWKRKTEKWWKFCTRCRLDNTPAFSPVCCITVHNQTKQSCNTGTLGPAYFYTSTEHVHVPVFVSAFAGNKIAQLRMFYSWRKAGRTKSPQI